jgi:hypothetical protein
MPIEARGGAVADGEVVMLGRQLARAPAAGRLRAVATRAPRAAARERQLERYLAGWAAADLGRILAAVAGDYRFEDPLVGVFDRDALGAYLALLRERVGFGTVRAYRRKVCFERFPSAAASGGQIRFWRSLPETGLAGSAEIELGAAGVRREALCYEANLATEQLGAGGRAHGQRAAR